MTKNVINIHSGEKGRVKRDIFEGKAFLLQMERGKMKVKESIEKDE